MDCWAAAEREKRSIRNSAMKQRHLPDHHSHLSASDDPFSYRLQSARRPNCLLSLRFLIALFRAPFLVTANWSRRRAEKIQKGQRIEGAIEELMLEEGMKKCGRGGDVDATAKKTYSASPGDYRLLEEVGRGTSATVYRAMYMPYNEIVAVKCLDLDRCSSNLDDIRREIQTMNSINHPNLVACHCSFVVQHILWLVMPFMAEGSCFHLMKVANPNWFHERVIQSILKETLKALEYLHKNGNIHRDVKAGNILIGSSGAVKLSDFGLTAGLIVNGDEKRSRSAFVGTLCRMAPEMLRPGRGYDFKADIWSFGITALELALGHAPFLKYPPMKVLLMTLQNAPFELDYAMDKKFSKSFKEMVSTCLLKDPTKRPTAENLLKHSFFKNAMPPGVSVKRLFADLPPLWDRVKALQLKEAELLELKKIPSSKKEALFEDRPTSGPTTEKPLDADKISESRAEGENQISCDASKAAYLSDPLIVSNHASANTWSAQRLSLRECGESPEDISMVNVVQTKGRFSFTSENVHIVKGSLHKRSASVGDCLSTPKQVLKAEITERERLLLLKISELQARLICLTEELTAARLEHTQLQQQLDAAYLKRNGERA